VQTPDGRYLRDRQIAEATVAYMQAVGINALLKVVEFPTHSTGVTQHKVEAFLLSWSFPDGYPEPSFYSVFHSTEGGGQATWAQWQNPEADALMDRVRNEPDEATRSQLYQKIMKIFMDNAIIKPIYREPIMYVADKSVTDFAVLSSNIPAKMIATDVRRR
jgi:ABC-type transport system substrate-binding protein